MPTAEAIRPIQKVQVEASRARMMPCPSLPEKSKRFPSPERKRTAYHESNHVFAALANGATVISVSVEPDSSSLGRTIIGGWVSIEAFQEIAAGGGVHTHHGSAEGYGGDMSKVEGLHYGHGARHNWESALSQARRKIAAMCPPDVRERFAEIVAYLGKVEGSDIPAIIQRAQVELEEEKGLRSETFEPIFAQFKSEYRTIAETLPNNMFRITYVVIGKENKEEMLCGLCKGVNSHLEKCPNTKLKEDPKGNPKENLFSSPKMGVIFSQTTFSKR